MRDRRLRAMRAATAVASDLGLRSSRPRILKDSNNTVIHLSPLPLVAKVATTSVRARVPGLLERELEVGLHLARRGAPIAPPASAVPPGPHRHDGLVVTLWELLEHDTDTTFPHTP